MPATLNRSSEKEALRERLRQRAARPGSRPQQVPRRSDGSWAPLSFIQRQMWVIDQMAPGNPAYNLPVGFRLSGPLELRALESALNEIVRRHEVLRTTFALRDGEPVQIVHPPCPIHVQYVRLDHLPRAEQADTLQRMASDEAACAFDLARLPLIRACVFKLGDTEHFLVLNLHHIVADGLSLKPFWEELDAFYRAALSRAPARVPELSAQYGDFAAWQCRNFAPTTTPSPAIDFWLRQLGGVLPTLDLPTDRPRPSHQTFRGSNVVFPIPAPLAQDLKTLGAGEGCTFFMTMLAVFEVLLHRYTGAEDLLIGSPVAFRTPSELQPLIGAFLNMVALRGDLSGSPTFIQLLRRTRELTLNSFSHGAIPLEVLLPHLKYARDPSRNPIFQVAMQFLTTTTPKLGDLEVSVVDLDLRYAQFDLTLHLNQDGEGFRGRLEYCTDLFDRSTIERLGGHYVNLLEAIVREPGRTIAALPLLTAAESRQVLEVWNPTTVAYPAPCPVHQLVEEQARVHPQALAAEAGGKRLTYHELNVRADLLAGRLRGLPWRTGALVGVYLEPGLDWLIGLLAVWKAGGAYVPIDPEYPSERVRFMLEETEAVAVLTRAALVSALPVTGIPAIDLDTAGEGAATSASRPVEPGEVSPEQLAYVIFTSGSTGHPKGVPIRHANLFNLVCWHRQAYAVTPADRASQLAGPAFDASVWEIWPYLAAGASLHFPEAATRQDAPRLVRWLADEQITLAFLPTPLAEAALRESWPEPLALRVLLTGGDLLHQRPTRPLPFRLVNHYGPTENTVVSTCAEVVAGRAQGSPPIGRPLPNTQAYVLNGGRQLAPIGVPGELALGGVQLTAGYWRRPELTGEKFIPNPFCGESGAHLYLTGDRVRWLPDGNLEFLGRLDRQCKLRGFRLELGEIEAVLRQHPAVRQAVAVLRSEPSSDPRLVAYVVVEKPAAELAASWRALLKSRLPAYMIPAAYVQLGALPLTPNGKLDYDQLPAPERQDAPAGAYVAPRTSTEEILAGILATALGLERVGIDDDFFALGGHSLLGLRVVSRVRQALGVELPLRELFAAPTVVQLASLIAARQAGSPACPAEPLPEQAAEAGTAELSFAQQRLWFLDQMELGRTIYAIPAAVELRGELNVPALERALGALVGRHASLRTRFVVVERRPRQLVSEVSVWRLPVVDLSGEPEAPARLEKLLHQETTRGFDLAQGPLFRAQLCRLSAVRHVLLLAMHHIISDGWSIGILFRELGCLYGCFCQETTPQLPALGWSYLDFTRWQRAWLRDEVLENLLAYWRARLAGAPQVLELPTDRPRPAVESNRGARHVFTLPAEETDALRRFARSENATLYMMLLAGFAALLSRQSGQTDLLIGTPVANRNRPEAEDVVGCFVNTVVLRAELAGDPSGREFLARIRETCLEALAHQELPFERLVEALRPARDLSRNPLVQVLFGLQNTPLRPLELPGLTQSLLVLDPAVAQVDLSLQVEETPSGLAAYFEYATDLFDAPTIERLATHWRTLLAAWAANPERRLSELPLLTPRERQQLLGDWNQTTQPYPRQCCVHGLIEAQAERTREAVAVSCGEQSLTYQELNHRAHQVARYLRRLGAGPHLRVGICLERSVEMVAAVLAVLKTGAAYVPLDPSLPPERLGCLAEDAQLGLLVSTSAQALSFGLPRDRQLLLDADAQALAESAVTGGATSAATVSPDLPAYIIYTSGSTGVPKGVVVPQRAVVNFLTSMSREPGLGASDVLVAVTTLAFDIAVLELLLPLTVGARVVIARREHTVEGRALATLLEQTRATVMQATPATWRLLLDAGWTPVHRFKALVGGETLPRDLASRLLACGVELWNLYGPTETTVWSTCARITTRSGITIGRPIANTQIRILDVHQELCPVGVPGELCIGGEGVSLGYWKRPELTAERFIPDPFGGAAGGRLYCTGDRARWRSDGTLEHLGRLDFQIKLRGFRIEPGEIEAVLAQDPAIRDAVILAREDTPGEKRLVAYLVASQPPAELPDRLRARLRARLPEYMVPARFVLLEALPRTPNGKLDRQRLPPPDTAETLLRPPAVAPRNATEELVMSVFRTVLERSDFGVFESFFDLGGHSLLAARLIFALQEVSGVNLPLRQLFERPTVAALAEAIDGLAWLAKAKEPRPIAGRREEVEL